VAGDDPVAVATIAVVIDRLGYDPVPSLRQGSSIVPVSLEKARLEQREHLCGIGLVRCGEDAAHGQAVTDSEHE
jgi:hypothetical protein